MSRWRVTSYDFFGVKLYGVESSRGYTEKYCDTKEDAQESVDAGNAAKENTAPKRNKKGKQQKDWS